MKIGVITDAHANLPAFQAALTAMNQDGCDLIVHTGDAIGIGPHPREVLEHIQRTQDLVLIMGNHDAMYCEGIPQPLPDWMSVGECEHQRWTHDQIRPAMRGWVESWPYSIDMNVGNTSVRFQHYGLVGKDFAKVSQRNLPSELDAAFQPTTDLVFFGHHHPRADIQGLARYINPGALGCNVHSGARYALLDVDEMGNPQVTLKSVPYDFSGVLEDMTSRDVPEADFILKAFLQ